MSSQERCVQQPQLGAAWGSARHLQPCEILPEHQAPQLLPWAGWRPGGRCPRLADDLLLSPMWRHLCSTAGGICCRPSPAGGDHSAARAVHLCRLQTVHCSRESGDTSEALTIDQSEALTSFTSTNVKLRKLLRFDVHLTVTWTSLHPYINNPYLTLIRRL